MTERRTNRHAHRNTPRRVSRGARRRGVLWALFVLLGTLGAAHGEPQQSPPTGSPEMPSVTAPAPQPASPAAVDPASRNADVKNTRAGRASGADAGGRRYTPSTRALVFEGGEGKRVYHIRIEDVIDLGITPFIERVVEEANAADDVIAIISEINTPGGRVDAAVRIRDALLESKVPTIAFINTEAISAGALIAYAHDYIVVVEGATMGAATPIQMGGGGQAEPVEEKMTSYMRGVMRATAEAKDRDGDIAEAMVDRTIEVPGVSEEGKLFTGSKKQLLDYGVADLEVESFDDVMSKMKLTGASVERPELSWAELIARFLTHPATSSLLMSFGFLGLLIEFYTPGFGFPGAIGITFLVLFFAGHLVVHLAGVEELLLFVLGIALLFVELFVTPGFGVIGGLGALFIMASLVLALIGLPLDISFETGDIFVATSRVSLAFVVTAVLFAIILRVLPRTGPGRRLVLRAVAAEGGPATVEHALGTPARDRPADEQEGALLAGRRGTAMTDLRPAGRALVDGRRWDVVTDGEYLERGDALEVVEASGLRVVVRAVRGGAEGEETS